MKKVLIVVHDMKFGGVQKSLLSFLQCFAKSEYADRYSIDLLILEPRGELLSQIPAFVNILPPTKPLRWLGTPMNLKLLGKYFSCRGLLGELIWIAAKKCRLLSKNLNGSQKLWKIWKWLIPSQKGAYDIAVSYQDGCPNYYTIDKVDAKNKILWLHIDYKKQRYDPAFDERYYKACDTVVTVSENCRNCFLEVFPQFEAKTHVLENITSAEYVLNRGNEPIEVEYDKDVFIKILSVGRLNLQKGFDIAIDAAKLLRDAGAEFQWLVVGEGLEREQLQRQIDKNELSRYFMLIGARENPYAYMKACDILVISSRFEGKPIVLDEAKIFCKPIVSTNYATVKASVEHGKSGWIVDMTPQSLCEGILRVMQDEKLKENLANYLKYQPKGNVHELQRYVQVMLET